MNRFPLSKFSLTLLGNNWRKLPNCLKKNYSLMSVGKHLDRFAMATGLPFDIPPSSFIYLISHLSSHMELKVVSMEFQGCHPSIQGQLSHQVDSGDCIRQWTGGGCPLGLLVLTVSLRSLTLWIRKERRGWSGRGAMEEREGVN